MFFGKIQVIAAALSGFGYISSDLFLQISEVADPRKKTGTPKIIKQIVSMLEKVREEPQEGAAVKPSITEELGAVREEQRNHILSWPRILRRPTVIGKFRL
jgi:hypothetical protein